MATFTDIGDFAAVLYHTEAIDGLNFGLWLGATFTAAAGSLYYWGGRSKQDF